MGVKFLYDRVLVFFYLVLLRFFFSWEDFSIFKENRKKVCWNWNKFKSLLIRVFITSKPPPFQQLILYHPLCSWEKALGLAIDSIQFHLICFQRNSMIHLSLYQSPFFVFLLVSLLRAPAIVFTSNRAHRFYRRQRINWHWRMCLHQVNW